jgi:4-amino-4-deoxy-L-arabinose transferase-like glycosyltransferase
MNGSLRKRVYIFAMIIFFVALALRLGYSLPQPETHWDEDEIVYLTIARNFVAGDGLILTPYRKAAFPPLYPIFLAGLIQTGFSIFPAVRVIQSILGAVSCLLLVSIVRMIFREDDENNGIGSGLVSAGLMAFYPILIFYSARLMTETLVVFLILASVFSLLKGLHSPHWFRWLSFGGAILGLGILCRPKLLPLSVLGVLWLFMVRSEKRRFIKSLLSLVVPLILVIMPWEVRNYQVFGKVVPITSAGGANLYMANNTISTGGTIRYRELMEEEDFHLGEKEDELAYNRYYRDKAFSFIKKNPVHFIRLAFNRLLWFYHLDYHYQGSKILVILFHLMLVLAIIGAWLSRRHWRKTILWGMVILNYTVIHMVFLPDGRYRLPMIPFILAFSSIPIFQSLNYLRIKYFK